MASITDFDNYGGYMTNLIANQTPPEAAFIREFYRMLFVYYQQNGLYDWLNENLKPTKSSSKVIKPLRNPAWRVVEFYASKIFPGQLPDGLIVKSDNDKLAEPIEQIWDWSNFSSTKQKWVRWFAIYGDWFIKISTKDGENKSVYMSLIKPENVSAFELDERGFITYLRIDLVKGKDEYYLEEWDKETQLVRVWNHTKGLDVDIEKLGTPTNQKTFTESHGDNFVPFVYQSFRDDGSGRANGAFTAQLDKIDEANRQATRLAQILFRYNKAIWVATNNGVDNFGRPLPPVAIEGMGGGDNEITIDDDSIISLPGNSDVKSLIPNINYGDALSVLESQVGELTKDLPELSYYELRSMGDLSGKAISLLLDDMISRVVEARGNAESALARAHGMALTIGQNIGVIGSDIGKFEDGDFKHTFAARPILPENEDDTATTIGKYTSAGATLFAAAQAVGKTDEDAKKLADTGLNFAVDGEER